jgi:Predicted double-glycine peptidase
MDAYCPREVKPKEELRFSLVSEQGFDRSCGYSAASSLLTLYWNIQIGESELIGKYAPGSKNDGPLSVNFETLARIFADYGFDVKGVRMSYPQLAAALEKYAPILVHYDRPDKHFALAMGAKGDWIITLDPALGCELQTRGQFLERWSGAALLVDSKKASRDDGRIESARRDEWDRLTRLEEGAR